MVDVTLLGTGGMMPLPYRWLTSLMIRYNGSSLLIDCGEGTQITMKQRGWSANPIDVICFTHYHADHISGLPGLLLDMANSDRTEPVTLIGPKGLERVVSGLRVIAPELPFEVRLIEFSGEWETFELFGYRLKAFKVNHSITCYGYSFEVDRAGRFDKDAAVANNIPLEFWSRLQSGETIVSGDVTYEPSMVMGPDRKGIKVTYCTDTRPVPSITENAAGSDLCILEGMYGEAEDAPKALKKKHMTMQEAAKIAAQAGVRELWLTHFSPSMGRAKKYEAEIKEIFPSSLIPKDGESRELNFEED
ncbi:MAG: ribonuclease Z [Lachnospiraceae bacterium]|nr:ribonuclease Z [Lachnospiraceae bacterium]